MKQLFLLSWIFALCSISLGAWAAIPPTYRFIPSGHDGGGGQSAIAVDPFNPSNIISGGDIWGLHKSTNQGREFHPVNVPVPGNGVFGNEAHFKIAAVRYSKRTRDRVYAGVGLVNQGAGTISGGAFLRSDDGGETWAIKSTVPQFAGSNTDPPLVDKGHPRSVGNLIALDSSQTNEIIYVGTYMKGVMRSSSADPGASWTTISLPGLTQTNSFTRGIAIDDLDPQNVYVGLWDTDGDANVESIYKISNARSATSAQVIPNTPFNKAEELVVVNGVLYVAANNSGVYKYDGSTWTQVYSDSTPSTFYSIDGYWDSARSEAVIFASTTDKHKAVGGTNLFYSVIRSKTSGSAGSWVCITKSKIKVNMPMGDASGDIWWHSDGISALIGGGSFVACQTLVDPANPKTLYVCGRAGLWRTDNADADNPDWYPCVRRMNSTVVNGIICDPNRDGNAYCTDFDWTFMWSTDSFNHVRQKATGIGGGSETDEEWCLAVDSTTNPSAVSPVYMGRGRAIAYNPNPPSAGWQNLNLPITTNAVKGVTVKKISEGTVVLAAVADSGIWRKVGAGPNGTWSPSPVYSGSNVMANLSNVTKSISFSWGGGTSEMVYMNDRKNGVYRSMDGGKNWIKINNPVSSWFGSGKYSGTVAVDPTNAAHCYVTTAGGSASQRGVWFSSNANAATPTFSKLSIPGLGSAIPGNVVFDSAGNLYVNTLVNGSTGPKLLYRAKGDATWHDLAAGSSVFRSQMGFGRQFVIGPGPNYTIYLCGPFTGVTVGTRREETSARLGLEQYNR